MNGYKSAVRLGQSIYVKDSDGGLHIVKSHQFKFGLKDPTGLGQSIFGDKIREVTIDTVADAAQFVYDNTGSVYGMDNLVVQYLKQFDTPTPWEKFKILSIDIENEYDPSLPYQRGDYSRPILSISCTLFANGIDHKSRTSTVVLGLHENIVLEQSLYKPCDSEEGILSAFCDLIRKFNPDIITGYNSSGHDIPYIISRMKDLGMSINQLSPFYNSAYKNRKLVNDRDPSYPVIAGLTHLDFAELYKDYSGVRLVNNKLDTVAEHELGERKLDHSDYDNLMDLYYRNPTKFYEYNGQDSRLVLSLEAKNKFIRLAVTVALIGQIRINDYHSQIAFWDSVVWKLADESNMYIPPVKVKEKADFKGAFVKKTIVGLHKNIITFDAESLYPSVMRALNLSIDKYIGVGPKVDGASYAQNGARFKTDSPGIMTIAVTRMFDLRKKTKKSMQANRAKAKMVEPGSTEYIALMDQADTDNIYQLVFKLGINSLYGIHGCEFFRYYDTKIAEAITQTGAFVNKHFAIRLNDWVHERSGATGRMFMPGYLEALDYQDAVIDALPNIITTDTDSSYVCVDPIVNKDKPTGDLTDYLNNLVINEIAPNLALWSNELVEVLQLMTNTFNYKREAIALKGLFRAKKQYVLLVTDMEGERYPSPKLKVVGLEPVKVSTPDWAKEKLRTLYTKLFDHGDVNAYYTETKDWFETLSLDDVAKAQRVNGIEKHTDEVQAGASPVVKGSVAFNQMIEKAGLPIEKIVSGDMVKWVYLTLPNPANAESIAFPPAVGLPAELGLEPYVDRKKAFDSAFGSAAVSTAGAAGIDLLRKQSRLNKFFTK